MWRQIKKKRHWKIGDEKVSEIKRYFYSTGDTDVNIAAKFGLKLSMTNRLTRHFLTEEKIKHENQR